MRPQLLLRKVHRWLGLILGIQVLLWFLSGFLMSWMPIEEVRGTHFRAEPVELPDGLDLGDALSRLPAGLKTASFKWLAGEPVIQAGEGDDLHLYSLEGKRLTPLDDEQIKSVLAEDLKTEYLVESLRLLDEVPNEARGRPAPVWQAQIAGPDQARVYVSPDSGEILAVRTNQWRLFDFLWMLHIMDYDEREDFNHPLLYLTALSALLFTISGFVLLYFSFRPRRKPA